MGQIEPGGQEELALIQRAASGDHEAFRDLVLTYEAKLLAYLTQMLGDPECARDVAQETFIAVFHALPRWRPLASHETTDIARPLAPWLYRIATNRALSLVRKQNVRRRVHSSKVNEDAVPGEERLETERYALAASAYQASFEESYIARELLRQALSSLSEDDAACLVLHYVSGERYGEIAERLGLSSEAVRKRIARALAVLRKTYLALDTEVRP